MDKKVYNKIELHRNSRQKAYKDALAVVKYIS